MIKKLINSRLHLKICYYVIKKDNLVTKKHLNIFFTGNKSYNYMSPTYTNMGTENCQNKVFQWEHSVVLLVDKAKGCSTKELFSIVLFEK